MAVADVTLEEVGVDAPTPTQLAIESLERDIKRSTDMKDWIQWIRENVEPALPEGVTLPTSAWSYTEGQVTVNIPVVEGRQWAGLEGTAGLIVKLRKLFNVKKLERQVNVYSESVSNYYWGTGFFNTKSLYLHIDVGAQLPPTCHVEYVVEEVPATTRKRAKVTCD